MSGGPGVRPERVCRGPPHVRTRLLWRAALGGTLVLLLGALGCAAGSLWLFPSLGPSIYMLVVLPRTRSARAYDTFAGHLIACL